MFVRRVSTWTLSAALLTLGCGLLEPPAPPSFEARIRVFSDPNVPLPGARVVYKSSAVGTTDETGTVNFRLTGTEGQVYDLVVRCPEGFTSPSKPVSVALRKLADPAARPEYRVDCPPSTRKVVVAVRADNGKDLPVIYLGRELARTDESGAAHVMLTVPPNQLVQLKLSTEGEGAKDLRPQNPVASFAVKDRDEVLVFEQKFKVERKAVRIYRPRAPTGPKPL